MWSSASACVQNVATAAPIQLGWVGHCSKTVGQFIHNMFCQAGQWGKQILAVQQSPLGCCRADGAAHQHACRTLRLLHRYSWAGLDIVQTLLACSFIRGTVKKGSAGSSFGGTAVTATALRCSHHVVAVPQLYRHFREESYKVLGKCAYKVVGECTGASRACNA